MAVDGVGNVYVTDGRVVELAAGSSTPTVRLQPPNGGAVDVAVDKAGNLYFLGAHGVEKLPIG